MLAFVPLAFALTAIVAGATKALPLAGLVMVTLGGTVDAAGGLTVTVTDADVVSEPSLSVAMAVNT